MTKFSKPISKTLSWSNEPQLYKTHRSRTMSRCETVLPLSSPSQMLPSLAVTAHPFFSSSLVKDGEVLPTELGYK